MQPSKRDAILAAACLSVAVCVSQSDAADRFEVPSAVIAQPDGSFHYVWKFYKGPGSVVLAGLRWIGTENVNGGLQGDCFCIPETCTIEEGDSLAFSVDGQLVDPEEPGTAVNNIGFCVEPGYESSTRILPHWTTGAGDEPREQTLRLWNGPNPFAGQTTFHYVLPGPGRVVLRVHDLLGRTIATVVDQVEAGGRHSATWNARGGPVSELRAGVYFGRLDFRGRIQSATLVIVP